MNTADPDFSKRFSLTESVTVDNIFQSVDLPDKVLGGNHLFRHLEEIALHLNLKPDVSPCIAIDIQGILLRYIQVIYRLLLLIESDLDWLLLAGRDEKFLKMLVGNRIV